MFSETVSGFLPPVLLGALLTQVGNGTGRTHLRDRILSTVSLIFFLRDLRKGHNELFRDSSLWSKLHKDRQLDTNYDSKIVSNIFYSCTLLTIAVSCLTFLRHITHDPVVTLWMGAENDVHRLTVYANLKTFREKDYSLGFSNAYI